ncbi:GHKL domain-containing protein [Clostridia bacterium OttesenSCG-928-F22]|nr:GHKL domain-containing protein [Clostridia bacterium OttesenSCG-928-F22]
MALHWILIETLAVLVENLAKVYFIGSQFQIKYNRALTVISMWLVQVVWGLFATFYNVNQVLYDVISPLLLLGCTYFLMNGSFLRKLFTVALTAGISFSTSLAGAGIAGVMLDSSIGHTLQNQDASRLLAIIFIKMLQVAVFFALAKRTKLRMDTGYSSGAILVANTLLCLASEYFLWFYASSTSLPDEKALFLVATSVCTLLILIGGFVMHELFARLEQRNIALSTSLQRAEMEKVFQEEMENIHSDLMLWKHEYKNNLYAILGKIESDNKEEAVEYIENILGSAQESKPLLLTNNNALNAVVSSKLWLAQLKGIEVDLKAYYPHDEIHIADNDLCSICGNLLDNAIEACERMEENDVTVKFISFELRLQERNLIITIKNSYSGEVLRDGEKFITTKNKKYGGIGIKYVDSIADKYSGCVLRNYDGRIFTTHVSLPLLRCDEIEM